MTHFQNAHVSCYALGLAVKDGEALYVSGAGPTGSTSSIWASVVSNNSGILCPEWYSRSQEFRLCESKGGSKTVWSNLPESTYKHFTTAARNPNAIFLDEPKAAGATERESVALRLERMNEVYHRFFLWMKANLDVPVLKSWAKTIWTEAKDTGLNNTMGIHQMHSFGDCIGAWKLEPGFAWAELISDLVRHGQLTF